MSNYYKKLSAARSESKKELSLASPTWTQHEQKIKTQTQMTRPIGDPIPFLPHGYPFPPPGPQVQLTPVKVEPVEITQTLHPPSTSHIYQPFDSTARLASPSPSPSPNPPPVLCPSQNPPPVSNPSANPPPASNPSPTREILSSSDEEYEFVDLTQNDNNKKRGQSQVSSSSSSRFTFNSPLARRFKRRKTNHSRRKHIETIDLSASSGDEEDSLVSTSSSKNLKQTTLTQDFRVTLKVKRGHSIRRVASQAFDGRVSLGDLVLTTAQSSGHPEYIKSNVAGHFQIVGIVKEFVMEEVRNAADEVTKVRKFLKIEAPALKTKTRTFGSPVKNLFVPYLEAFKVASYNSWRLEDLDEGTALNVSNSFYFCVFAKEWKMV